MLCRASASSPDRRTETFRADRAADLQLATRLPQNQVKGLRYTASWPAALRVPIRTRNRSTKFSQRHRG